MADNDVQPQPPELREELDRLMEGKPARPGETPHQRDDWPLPKPDEVVSSSAGSEPLPGDRKSVNQSPDDLVHRDRHPKPPGTA
jgi:hypothetical protein